MERRHLLLGLGAVGTMVATAARGQQLSRVPRIGMLLGYSENDPELKGRLEAFTGNLEKLGWLGSRAPQIDYRFAGTNLEKLNAFASDLVTTKPDIIVVQSNPALTALMRVNRTVPTVFIQVADPVAGGFVESIARPGGIVTGFTNFLPESGGKWIELIREVSPNIKHVSVLMNMETKANVTMYQAAAATAKVVGIDIVSVGASNAEDIEKGIADCARESGGGIVALPHVVTAGNRSLISQRCLAAGLPSVGAFSFMARSGCLASYGIDVVDLFKKSADYVDRILRGAKPSDLPVQLPSKFELVVNLKTAKALGLEIAPTLLARADEVIE